MIYLDNGATTYPKPKTVVDSVDNALRIYSANPGRGGHRPSVKAAEAVFRARENIADFFDINGAENVIFTNNCTSALNKVIKGVLSKGDHVVISSLEHNSVLRPLEKLKQNGIITYTVADVKESSDETVDSFRNAVNENTRLFVCTHASNVFGKILPVEKLCALAHNYGILFCLDAAQSAGVLDIDILRDGYDFVCCAGHKGLYGPMGTGLLMINRDIRLDTVFEGGTGSDSADPLMPEYTPDRFESGTLNVPGIIGLSAGINFIRRRGVRRIYEAELEKLRRVYKELEKNNKVKLFTPYPEYGEYAPVLSFQIEGADSETVAAFLDKNYGIAVRAGLHCAPLAHKSYNTFEHGTVRVSPSVFTTEKDIRTLIYGVNYFVQNIH